MVWHSIALTGREHNIATSKESAMIFTSHKNGKKEEIMAPFVVLMLFIAILIILAN